MKQTPFLIIEDEAEVRNFASRVLELEGYAVLQAEDAETGLTLARKNRVALVLLDLRLPQRDGWSVLAEMKADAELRDISVIIFSASAATPQQEKAFAMGADDYLTKPLSAAKLRDCIAHVLSRRG